MSLRRLLLLAVVLMPLLAQADGPAPPAGKDASGDPLPAGAVARLGSARLRPDSSSVAIAFSADGKSLVTVGLGPSVQVWDVETGRERRRFSLMGPPPVPPPPVIGGSPWSNLACFTLDSKVLVVFGTDGQLRIFDTDTGKLQRSLPLIGTHHPQRLSLSEDGKRLAVKQLDNNVSVWDLTEGKSLFMHRNLETNGLAVLTPDGKQLVAGLDDRTVHLVDAVTGKKVRKLEAGLTAAAATAPQTQRLALSRDGKTAVFSSWGSEVSITSLETGKLMTRISPQGGGAQAIALAPNGRFLAVGGYPGVHILGLTSGKEVRLLECVPTTFSQVLAYSPDGTRLAAVGQDGGLRLWDVINSREVHRQSGHTATVIGLVFLRDGELVSVGQDNRMVAWDVMTGRPLHEQRGLPFSPLSVSRAPGADGIQVIGYDHNLHVWRPGTGIETVTRDANTITPDRLLVSPDGTKWLVTSNTDRKMRLFEKGHKGREERLLQAPASLWAILMGFSPDGGRVFAAMSDGKYRVWDCGTAGELQKIATGSPFISAQHAQFSPDGRGLLMDGDEVRLIEVASGKERARFAALDRLTAMACSRDGRLLARGCSDGSVVVSSLLTGRDLARFEGAQGVMASLAFSDDNRLLATGGGNGQILVWKLPRSEAPVATLTEGQKTTLWGDLADLDGTKAGQAMAALDAAPGPAVELLRDRLKFVGVVIDPKKLEKFVADLGSEEFVVRERASAALAAAGGAAEQVIRKALEKSPGPEARRRLQELLDRLDDKSATPERLRAIRAIEVLERLGTTPARKLLARLAEEVKDPGALQEVRDSLRRLGGPKE
jgi:WD40 repeat protein